MATIDVEIITLGVLLMAPVYVYLHKMSLTLSKFSTIVQNCKYCIKNGDLKNEEVEQL